MSKILLKIKKKLEKKRIPVNVTFEVTKKCNLDCLHCYVDHDDTARELNIEKQKRIIDELYDLGVVYITFSGGELFVKEGVWELFEHTRRKKMGFKIITAATLLEKNDIDRLKNLGVLEVGVSIYSDKSEIHDFITKRPGSLNKTLKAVKYMNEIGIVTVSKTLIMNINKNDIKNVYKLTSSLGMIPTFDLTVTGAQNNVRNPKKYALNKREIYDLFKDREVEKILLDNKPLEERYCGLKKQYKPDEPRCEIGRGAMWIDAKGLVYPCISYPYPVGDLTAESLKEIWYDNPEIEKILELAKYKNYKSCHNCKASLFCDPCLGLSVAEGRSDLCCTPYYDKAFALKKILDEKSMSAFINF